MSDNDKPAPPTTDGSPNFVRRRALKGGLAAGPVLMTLVSRPVMAGGKGGGAQCTTPSAFCSANASGPGGEFCEGRTLGYWKNHTHWPGGYSPSTPFNSVFAHNTRCYPNKTLHDVLQLQGGAPYDDLARAIVAAWLNAAQGWTPVLSTKMVQDIWSEYLSMGYFSPSAGVKWYHDDIMTYLASTQTG